MSSSNADSEKEVSFAGNREESFILWELKSYLNLRTQSRAITCQAEGVSTIGPLSHC